VRENQTIIHAMFAIIHLLATFMADLFKSPRRLEVENLFLRHQLNIALRRAPQRVRLGAGDRALIPRLLCFRRRVGKDGRHAVRIDVESQEG
jgi:hypothetical protein